MRSRVPVGILAVVIATAACSDAEFHTTEPPLSLGSDSGVGAGDGGADDAAGSQDAGSESGASSTDTGTTDGGQTPACLEAEERCGQDCVDLLVDEANCGSCGNACSSGETCIAGRCEAEISAEVSGVLESTNDWRASGADCGSYGQKASTGPLVLDAELSKAAQAHADDMVANNFFDHTGSDGSNFSQRVGRTDYTGFAIGENLAAGGTEPAGVVQRWINSDGHCRNLMNPDARHIGIGFQVGGPYGTMWVQVFGR